MIYFDPNKAFPEWSLKRHRRDALLFCKVILQIPRSILTQLSVSGQQLHFEPTDGLEMMDKA